MSGLRKNKYNLNRENMINEHREKMIELEKLHHIEDMKRCCGRPRDVV